MKRKYILASITAFIMFFISGCSEKQLNQKLIVQGIGIDKNENDYQVTIQALDFQNPISEDEPNNKIIETNGETVTKALDNISKQTSLTPVYSQNLMLIISEKSAKLGVNDFIDFFIRHCETRPKVKICICEKPSEILKIKPSEKQFKSKNLHDLIPLQLNSDVLHFVSNLKNEKTSPWAAWIKLNQKDKETKEIHLKGACIFKEDKLIDMLEKDEAFGFMLLKGVPNFGSCVVNAGKSGDVTCKAEKIIPKIEVKISKENSPQFHINLDITASSFSLDKSFYTHNIDEVNRIIEENLAKKIKDICEKLISKLLKMEIDVFEFSKILKNSNPTYFRSIENSWKEILPKLNFELSEEIKLKVTGKEPV